MIFVGYLRVSKSLVHLRLTKLSKIIRKEIAIHI